MLHGKNPSNCACHHGPRGKVEGEPLGQMRVGKVEEAIIQRGFDWCTDVARVGYVHFQVASLPVCLVILANTDAT